MRMGHECLYSGIANKPKSFCEGAKPRSRREPKGRLGAIGFVIPNRPNHLRTGLYSDLVEKMNRRDIV